ncbi:MAG: peptidoglycan-binding protein [Caulobacter sp.]|nr:peptidoglycan-binding protein [Caulobacter sp.]
MTSGAPWSVKGIDPKAREIAKDLARRSGMTLGEWLNRMIVEGEPIDETPPGRAFDGPQEPLVVSTPRPSAAPRYEVAGHPADEVGRVAEAIERLTARIEAGEQRSTLAITGIDQSVRGALARLESAEREQNSVAARFEGAVDELKSEFGGVGQRLRKVELESTGPRSAEALRSLETMLGKVAGQVYEGDARTREAIAAVEARLGAVEAADPAQVADALAERLGEAEARAGEAVRDLADRIMAVEARDPAEIAETLAGRLGEAETRTSDAIRDLGASFVILDRRLRSVESDGGGSRLEALAADLTRRMEAARAEMAESLRATSEGRFDRMEGKLSEMASHIRTAESRSAEAIERMGREVVNMADSLSRRVQTVENRGADAVEQIGGEVARIANAVEQKLNRADTIQAQALEKLGGEIARITERLAERIANSERRGAQAIDEVGEQVARVTERISQRQERTSVDLAERIRLSEERTAKLLDEAREKIDASLNSSHRRLAEQVAQGPVAPAAAAPRRVDTPKTPFDDPFAAEPFPAAGRSIPEDAFAPQTFARTAAPAVEGEPDPFPAAERGKPAFSDEDIEAADGFATLSDLDDDLADPEIAAAPTAAPLDVEDVSRPRSTREMLDQARAAARMANTPEPRVQPTSKRGLFSATDKKPRRRAGSALQSALVLAAGAATLGSLFAAGTILSGGGDGGKVSDRVAEFVKTRKADDRGEVKTAEADTTPSVGGEPRLAVAIGPQGMAPAGGGVSPALAGGVDAPGAVSADAGEALYAEGVRRVEARDPTGVESLKRAANLGYPAAQFYLAKLYESGEAGLAKDAGEARRWTERAAQGGDRKAMHNLGLYYFEGQGGPKNTTTAAQWFRKAADLGLSDSQYNLGRLYEEGYGVGQNAAEAYKWYLIAARAGDGEARSSAERVKKDLPPDARNAAERSATGFRAAAPTAATARASASAGAANIASAQKALSTLGYYRGPQDGVASQGLKGAVAAFQREQGLVATGELDAVTVSKLSIYAR